MIPLPVWLANIQFVIGAFGTFAFFAAAWLNVDSWAVRKEFKTGLRALGFFILAIWSALHGIGSEITIITVLGALALAVGSVAIAISYAIDRPPLQPKALNRLRKEEQKEKVAQVLRGPPRPQTSPFSPKPKPTPPAPGAPLAAKSADSLEKAAVSAPAQQTATTKTARRPVRSSPPEQIVAKAGLRTEALVKLPKTAKRRRARFTLSAISLTILAALIAGAGYLVWTKTTLFREAPPEETPFIESLPEIDPSPESTDEAEAIDQQEPSPTPTNTITITETETGFLNVRDGDSTTTPVITQISPGESFELLDESEAGDWYKIQVDQETAGWIAARYAEKEQPAEE